MKAELLLQSHYLPSIHYMAALQHADAVLIEQYDHFAKQTYRNRCYIAGPNGRIALVVPIYGRNSKQLMKDVKISYEEDWVRMHWNSITSAYRSAPFFGYFDVELEKILQLRLKFLLDLNLLMLEMLVKRLGMKTQVNLTADYLHEIPDIKDLREGFPAKNNTIILPEYRQVFSEKYEFISNLSVIDLMANRLNGAGEYLNALTLQ